MILSPKRDGRKKARLILQGFHEPRSFDRGSLESPVAYLSTIRSLIFGPMSDTDIISSIDISVAFLQADEFNPDETPRYVKYIPYKGASPLYYKLRGPLYGQRSSPRRWFNTLKDWMELQGFKQGKNELCVFTHPDTGLKVVSFVDDLLVKGSPTATTDFYAALANRFECKDPSFLTPDDTLDYVGFNLGMDSDPDGNRTLYIEQSSQVQTFSDEYDLPPCRFKSSASPCFSKQALYRDPTPLDSTQAGEYRKILGSLNYFVSTLRYDMALPVSKLSQFMSNPTVSSLACAHRVMQYLSATSHFRISGRVTHECVYSHYSDSDHAGERPYHARSQTGLILTLNKVPVHWKSNKQTCTAYSSTAAEVMALSETVRQANFLQWAGEEMGYPKLPVIIHTDSKGARSFQSCPTLDSRLKGYFDCREDWVNELRDSGQVRVEKLEGRQNLADLLTKLMRPVRFAAILHHVKGASKSRGL